MGTFQAQYDSPMTTKRIPVGFPDALYKDLERLARKWGLDLTNTIRHAVARAVDQEFEKKGRTAHTDREESDE